MVWKFGFRAPTKQIDYIWDISGEDAPHSVWGKNDLESGIACRLDCLHKTGFRSMFDISDSGRRNTVNLGAFGHICTLTLQWYKIRFYGPYQTNRLNLRYIWEDAPHSVWARNDLESDIACRLEAMLIWTPDWWNVASCKCSTWTGILSCGGGECECQAVSNGNLEIRTWKF